MLCAGTLKTKDHECDVVGYMAKKGQNCTYKNNKCANCKGNHIVKSNVCPKKQEAIPNTKKETTNWRERDRGGKNIPQSKVPKEMEDRALPTQKAKKKTGESQKANKVQGKKEIQVPVMQQGSEESIPKTQW
jgi:hypothetical protein